MQNSYIPPQQQAYQGDPEEAHRNKLAVVFLILIGCIFIQTVMDYFSYYIHLGEAFWKIIWCFSALLSLLRSAVLGAFGFQTRDKGLKAVIIAVAALTLVLSLVNFVVINPFFGKYS